MAKELDFDKLQRVARDMNQHLPASELSKQCRELADEPISPTWNCRCATCVILNDSRFHERFKPAFLAAADACDWLVHVRDVWQADFLRATNERDGFKVTADRLHAENTRLHKLLLQIHKEADSGEGTAEEIIAPPIDPALKEYARRKNYLELSKQWRKDAARLREIYESRVVIQYREGHIDKDFLRTTANNLIAAADACDQLRLMAEYWSNRAKSAENERDASNAVFQKNLDRIDRLDKDNARLRELLATATRFIKKVSQGVMTTGNSSEDAAVVLDAIDALLKETK